MATPLVDYGFFQRTTPNWIGTPLTDPKITTPGGIRLDPAQFPREDAVTVVVAVAANANDTSITVTALAYADGRAIPSTVIAIPSGTILRFGVKKFAILTANAMGGATTLTVEELGHSLALNDTATYAGVARRRLVRSGTLVSRTFAERTAGTGYGPAVHTDDQIALVAFDIDLEIETLATAYQPNAGNVVYENFLPGFDALSSNLKTAIRSRYTCMIGNN